MNQRLRSKREFECLREDIGNREVNVLAVNHLIEIEVVNQVSQDVTVYYQPSRNEQESRQSAEHKKLRISHGCQVFCRGDSPNRKNRR